MESAGGKPVRDVRPLARSGRRTSHPRKPEETVHARQVRRSAKAAGAALSAKRGDSPKSQLKGPSKSMLSMSESQLEDFAHTARKGKPEHKSKTH